MKSKRPAFKSGANEMQHVCPSDSHIIFTDASGQVMDVATGYECGTSDASWLPTGIGEGITSHEVVATEYRSEIPDPTLQLAGICPGVRFVTAVEKFRMLPWGQRNSMPSDIMLLLKDDNLARPILQKQRGLFWGNGPSIEFDAKTPSGAQASADAFLTRSRWKKILLGNITDYFHTSCAAAYVVMNASGTAIESVRYLPVWQVRLAVLEGDTSLTPTHALVGDFSGTFSPGSGMEIKAYPLYDPQCGKLPTAASSVMWMSDIDFFANPYPLPVFAGGEEWIRRSVEAPRIIASFIDNSMSIRWVVHVPVKYWQDLKARILSDYKRQHKSDEEALSAYEEEKTRLIDNFINMLSGAKNVGKAIILETVLEIFGQNSTYEYKWKVEQVDLKVGDFIKTMIEISDKADAKKTGAFSLHAALANVGQTGRADSGSEQLYAYNNHLFSSVAIPSFILVEPLAKLFSVATGVGINIRFDRPTQQRQQDLSESDRLLAQDSPE